MRQAVRAGHRRSPIRRRLPSPGWLDRLDENRWAIARLNPWALGSSEMMGAELLGAIRSVLPEKAPSLRDKLKTYATYGLPAIGLLPGAGAAATKTFEMATRNWSDEGTLQTHFEEVAAELADLDQAVLVFVDDVDRLQPDELPALLRAIRVIGRLPNVHYIVAYDQQTLVDLLKSTSIAGGRAGRALAFLEKIVTLRADQPAIRPGQSAALFDKGLTGLLGDLGAGLSEEERPALEPTVRATPRRRGISHPDYVDRYFVFARGDFDMSDAELVTGLKSWAKSAVVGGPDTAMIQWLVRLLGASGDVDPSGLVRTLEARGAQAVVDFLRALSLCRDTITAAWLPELVERSTDLGWSVFVSHVRVGDGAQELPALTLAGLVERLLGATAFDERLRDAVDQGLPVITLASRFVEVGTDSGTRRQSILAFDAAAMAARLGPEAMRAVLVAPQAVDEPDALDVWWEGRRHHAAAALRAIAPNVLGSRLPVLPEESVQPFVSRGSVLRTPGNEVPDLGIAVTVLAPAGASPQSAEKAAGLVGEAREKAIQGTLDDSPTPVGWPPSHGPGRCRPRDGRSPTPATVAATPISPWNSPRPRRTRTLGGYRHHSGPVLTYGPVSISHARSWWRTSRSACGWRNSTRSACPRDAGTTADRCPPHCP